jgi:hypothetical protein
MKYVKVEAPRCWVPASIRSVLRSGLIDVRLDWWASGRSTVQRSHQSKFVCVRIGDVPELPLGRLAGAVSSSVRVQIQTVLSGCGGGYYTGDSIVTLPWLVVFWARVRLVSGLASQWEGCHAS